MILKILGGSRFSNKTSSTMNGNTSAKSQISLRTIISTVQIPLGFSNALLKVGHIQIFSVTRSLSPTQKSEKRVSYKIVCIL